MSNFEKLESMHDQLDKMWEELILMNTSEDPVARLHREDAKTFFCKLLVKIACMAAYEKK